MIVIIDYGMGNLASIKNMFHRIGNDDVSISCNKREILDADGLVLPGVGSFDQGMTNLIQSGLDSTIKEAVIDGGKFILGICLGMQLLGRSSEEGKIKGLGIIPFDTVRFRLNNNYKIPHMGWDEVKVWRETPLTSGFSNEMPRFYFVHSYHAICDDEKDILMTSLYGYEFTAAVNRENIYGVQFHPEKSHRFGMKILENFSKAINHE